MSADADGMHIRIEDRGSALRERLRERLEHVARLRCAAHHQPVVALTIHGRENGWFDARSTTCCDELAREAASILKDRC